MADEFLNDVIDHEMAIVDFDDGTISDQEAEERGILDYDGTSQEGFFQRGVQTVEDMHTELAFLDGALSGSKHCIEKLGLGALVNNTINPKRGVGSYKDRKEVWVSQGKIMLPEEMTDLHLKNAIAYSERNGIKSQIVDDMRDELAKRGQSMAPAKKRAHRQCE